MTSVKSIDFSPDGQHIVAICGGRGPGIPENVVQFWNLKKPAVQWEVAKSAAEGEIVFSPDGTRIAVAGGSPLLLNAANGAIILQSTRLSNLGISQLSYIDGGNFIIGISYFRPMVLWNSSDGDLCLPEWKEPALFGAKVRVFAVSSDRRQLAYIDGDVVLQA